MPNKSKNQRTNSFPPKNTDLPDNKQTDASMKKSNQQRPGTRGTEFSCELLSKQETSKAEKSSKCDCDSCS